MFELDLSYSILLVLCLVAACGFEFVNGFHDTANAVATVIYTNSLKPWVAVIWSGCWNFLGVLFGGVGVAMGIVNLLPVESLIDQNIAHSISMVMGGGPGPAVGGPGSRCKGGARATPGPPARGRSGGGGGGWGFEGCR
ncbi:inorganic phosphate transporter, partial [Fulvivirgaceae bacterium PWU37]|nr:inorganic phosphate transporter [Dawidia soli]